MEPAEQRRKLIDEGALSRLAGLPLYARIPMLGSVSGRHRSPIRGSSLEFAEYRKYVPGDDTRRMDWRAWGRSDRFYIKEFEADTNLRLCFLIDTSGSMGYAVNGVSKLGHATALVATLSYLAARQGDAVGLYCSGSDFHTEIPPKRGASQMGLLLDTLAGLEARGPTGLELALHRLAERVPRRALVIVVSDLFLEPERLKSCFQHLRFRRHDVAAFHLLDSTEVSFDFDRPTRFVDLEGGSPMLSDPAIMGRQFRSAMKNYREELSVVTREARVDYHRMDLRETVGDALSRFLIARQPRKKV